MSEKSVEASYSQERLWFLNQLQGEYSRKYLLEITGELNKDAIKSALDTIVERHLALRSNFIKSEDRLCQVVSLEHKFKVEEIVCSEDTIHNTIEEVLSVPFDLKCDSLFRAGLYSIGSEKSYLLIHVHEIIFDRYSFQLLIKELEILYSVYDDNQPNPLIPYVIDYEEYLRAQKDYFTPKKLEEKLAYWKNILSDTSPLELSTTYTRPSVQSYQSQRIDFKIDEETKSNLDILMQKYDASLYNSLLASFSLLLHRYTQQDDIVIGTIIPNRDSIDVKNLIGLFENTLVQRHNYSTDPSFLGLLGQVKSQITEASKYQDLPFSKIVDALNITRDPSRAPLCQAMFILDDSQSTRGELLGVTTNIKKIENNRNEFDITLNVRETDDKLLASIGYATDLFSEEYINSMIENFKELLSDITKDVMQNASQYSLLSTKEYQQQVVEYNNTKVDYDNKKTIHKLFEEQVEKTPNNIAVVYEDKALSYQELNERANQLAHYLIEEGVQSDELVAISVERSLEMVIGLLAILKAGGAYVPIDPNYPNDRIEYMIRDSNARILLTLDSLQASLPITNTQYLCIDRCDVSHYETKNPKTETTAENLIYVIYTSGSTGRPKGVMVQHAGLVNLAQAQINSFGIKENDRVVQFASFSFDAAASEMVMTWLSGANLILVRYAIMSDACLLQKFINENKVSVATLPPVMLSLLESESLKTLRVIISAGEACPFSIVQKFISNREFYNAYGPTENSVCTSIYKCLSKDKMPPPIGRGINNTQLYILDKYKKLVPKGAVGELHISGDGLARGYLNQPELTDEKFILNPFIENTKMYKTGDLVRYLEDGEIEYLGRIDDQVKIRGFRIELGEIEQQLLAMESIKESVVLAKEDKTGNKFLVAYLVTKDNEHIETSTIKEELSKHLTEYMIPSSISILEKMPLTPNGKADKKALAKLEVVMNSSQEYVAAKDETGKALSDIFSTVLNVKQVGVHDDFFELGGHSLLAVTLMAKINRKFNTSLPLAVLFQASSVAKLHSLVSTKEYTRNVLVPIQTKGDKIPIFGLPATGGSTVIYQALSKVLGDSQPFYGLDTIGPGPKSSPFTGLEETIKANITAIKSVHPKGPYRLIGFCFGSVMAFEMARILRDDVDSIIMLNAYSPSKPKDALERVKIMARLFIYKLKNGLSKLNTSITPKAFKALIAHYSTTSMGRYNTLCYDWYKAKPLDIKINVSLFCLRNSNYEKDSEYINEYGWKDLIDNDIAVNVIEGEHLTILQNSNVHSLSKTINSYYDSINTTKN